MKTADAIQHLIIKGIIGRRDAILITNNARVEREISADEEILLYKLISKTYGDRG